MSSMFGFFGTNSAAAPQAAESASDTGQPPAKLPRTTEAPRAAPVTSTTSTTVAPARYFTLTDKNHPDTKWKLKIEDYLRPEQARKAVNALLKLDKARFRSVEWDVQYNGAGSNQRVDTNFDDAVAEGENTKVYSKSIIEKMKENQASIEQRAKENARKAAKKDFDDRLKEIAKPYIEAIRAYNKWAAKNKKPEYKDPRQDLLK